VRALTVGSLFAGVEGFGQGLDAAGFTVAWQVEIDRDAVSVLERHYPNVRRYRDVREVKGAELAAVDVLVGGFPCQDLSVAGARKGLAGERSGLFFEIARIAAETATPWLLLENVDGLLSSWITHDPPPPDLGVGQRWESDESSSLGIVLSTLSNGGYGWAYRVLDAQFFGVAQRRRRAFIVGCLGDTGARAAEVLFEPESVLWDLAACLETGQGSAGVPEGSAGSGGIADTLRSHPRPGSNTAGAIIPEVAFTLRRNDNGTGSSDNGWNTTYIPALSDCLRANDDSFGGQKGASALLPIANAAPLTAGGHPGSNAPGRHREDDENLVAALAIRTGHQGANGHGIAEDVAHGLVSSGAVQAVAFNWQAGGGGNDESFRGKSRQYVERAGDYAGALSATRHDAIAFTNRGEAVEGAHETLRAGSHGALPMVSDSWSVRRLMPVECERLMGWADGWTERRADGSLIPDGPRYRLIGNGVVAPVARWIGERLRRAIEMAR
jgi:DNA (cytosine-5)-methyltransferase 1